MTLPIGGQIKNRKAASSVDLAALPFEGSMLRGAQRELRLCRDEIQG